MDVQKRDLYNLVSTIIPEININDKDRIKKSIDEWYELQEYYREKDKQLIQMKTPSKEVVILDNYYLDKELYLKLNDGMEYKRCILKLQESQLKYMREKHNISRNAYECFQLIMQAIGVKAENPYYGGKKCFCFEARNIIKSKGEDKVELAIPNDNGSQKAYLLCDLFDIWIKNRSSKEKIKINNKISMWDYLKTEEMLLSLLPAFDCQGKLKDYDQYKKDVSLIRGKIWEKIEDQNLEDEEIERDFNMLISRKSRTVYQDVRKKISSIGNTEHRILFMCKVLDLALANIEDVQSCLDIFIQRINDNQEENLTNKECQRILSEIMPERNRRLQC